MKKEVKEMRCLKDQNVILSDNEALLLSNIINSLGDARDHPFAEKDTLEYFTIEYCLELCDEARPLLTEEGTEVLNPIVVKLLLANSAEEGESHDPEMMAEFTTAILKRKAEKDKD